jgi:hypothetical protein
MRPGEHSDTVFVVAASPGTTGEAPPAGDSASARVCLRFLSTWPTTLPRVASDSIVPRQVYLARWAHSIALAPHSFLLHKSGLLHVAAAASFSHLLTRLFFAARKFLLSALSFTHRVG